MRRWWLGPAHMGVLVSALGAPVAWTAGATVTVLYAVWLAVAGHTVRDYRS